MSNETRRREIFDALPAYYRREGGRTLGRLVGIAEFLVDGLRVRVAERDSEDAADGLVAAGCGSLVTGPRSALATARELRRWLPDELHGARIWPDRRLEPTPDGELLVRQPSYGRAVVLAVSRSELSFPVAPEVPKNLLPVGVRLQWALLDEDPSGGRVPLVGSRLRGVVLPSRDLRTARSAGANGP